MGSEAATSVSLAERTLRRILEFQDRDDPRTPGTLVKALRESGEGAAELYRAWAEILPKVLPRLDWSKPFYWDWNKEPEYYRDHHDLYAREIAPFLGEWDRLRDVLTRVDAGRITDAEAKQEVRENAKAYADNARKENDQAEANERGGRPVDIVNRVTSKGNSRSYALRRLARQRPDLLAAFERGETTANAAAIAAGFRQPTWSAPADVDKLAAAIEKRYPGWRLVRT